MQQYEQYKQYEQYDAGNLVIHPGNSSDPDVVVEVTPRLAGWEYVSFQLRRLASGRSWASETGDSEAALVVIGGSISVSAQQDRWVWLNIGERKDVFSGLPYALYLPRHMSFTVSAESDSEFAMALAPTDQDHQPRLVKPRDIEIEIRGGDNVTRQINNIIPPGFPCQRLVVVEVYTPGGNWSSYPPHKHDVQKTGPHNSIVEADLEEVYFYKFDPPGGFAFQRIYTAPESPLQRAGYPIDAALVARNNDVVLVPEGYHPVSGAPGYTTYYLNVLAGSDQSLANSEDPRYAWVREHYRAQDPRVPVYDIEQLG